MQCACCKYNCINMQTILITVSKTTNYAADKCVNRLIAGQRKAASVDTRP